MLTADNLNIMGIVAGEAVRRSLIRQPRARLWMLQSGSSERNGSLATTFADALIWLDAIGQVVHQGVHRIFKHTLCDRSYGMIGPGLLRPSYWVTVLLKRLLGTGLLDVSPLSSDARVRAYAYCAFVSHATLNRTTHAQQWLMDYPAGSVVVTLLNIDATATIPVQVQGFDPVLGPITHVS